MWPIEWQLQVFPNKEMVAKNQVLLPWLVLFLGSLLACLGALATYFIQKNRQTLKELETARKKAEQANIAKSAFLANMSHEIRTPLNGVIGTASLLADMELDAKEKRYVDRIALSAKVLLDLINDILDFSKIEAGELNLEEVPCNFQLIVKDVIDIMCPRAVEKGLEMIVRYAPDRPINILSDPLRIKQIISNLVGNAIKFTQKGHVLVSISTKPNGHGQVFTRLEVQDTGIGIEPEKAQHLFQKFSQADISTTRKFGGSGLGLAICKELVHLLGGKIGFESEAQKGSTFWVEVHFKEDKRPRFDDQLSFNKIKKDLAGLKALIVDDYPVNLEILEEYVKKWDVHYTLCATPRQALQILEQKDAHFDIALLDYSMPEMNGMELAKQIRQMYPSISLIILSSLSSKEAEIDRAVVDECLIKPIYPFELHEAIVNALHKNSPVTSS